MTATVLDPVQAIEDCLGHQVRDALACAGDEVVLGRLGEIESVSRKVHALLLDVVAEVDSRQLAAGAGFGTTGRLLAGMLHLSRGDARTRVAHAAAVGPRRSLTGQALPARLPETAAALADGGIGPGQLRVVAEIMDALPASVGPADRAEAEAQLARHARSFDPTSLARVGARILDHLDPDGPEPDDEPATTPAAGELRLRERRDGRLDLQGWLGAEHQAAFRALIEQFAAPRPAAENIPDPRGGGQPAGRRAARDLRACPRRRGLPHHRR
ncbi:MAG: DUF222 domain-containing protein [Pseudonocardiaceae bacterium]|nr:DUF222 domain-containing protein [Pseudonocardiaceae bacterium]